MSWSIVRTCRRCGARAEREIRDLATVASLTRVLEHHFARPGSDDGCPACDPRLLKLLEDAKSADAARRRGSS